jgi:hypothetical protein
MVRTLYVTFPKIGGRIVRALRSAMWMILELSIYLIDQIRSKISG